MSSTITFDPINWIIRICDSISLELLLPLHSNISTVNFVIRYICDSILFQDFWLSSVDISNIHWIPSFKIPLFSICVDFGSLYIFNIKFIMSIIIDPRLLLLDLWT